MGFSCLTGFTILIAMMVKCGSLMDVVGLSDAAPVNILRLNEGNLASNALLSSSGESDYSAGASERSQIAMDHRAALTSGNYHDARRRRLSSYKENAMPSFRKLAGGDYDQNTAAEAAELRWAPLDCPTASTPATYSDDVLKGRGLLSHKNIETHSFHRRNVENGTVEEGAVGNHKHGESARANYHDDELHSNAAAVIGAATGAVRRTPDDRQLSWMPSNYEENVVHTLRRALTPSDYHDGVAETLRRPTHKWKELDNFLRREAEYDFVRRYGCPSCHGNSFFFTRKRGGDTPSFKVVATIRQTKQGHIPPSGPNKNH